MARSKKPTQPEILKKVQSLAHPVDPEQFSLWRRSCANHGHILRDVHLQYLSCDSNLGRHYVVCNIVHECDTFGKDKGIRFVSPELSLEKHREIILYRDSLNLDIDEPKLSYDTPAPLKKPSTPRKKPSTPRKTPSIPRKKKTTAIPFSDSTSVRQNAGGVASHKPHTAPGLSALSFGKPKTSGTSLSAKLSRPSPSPARGTAKAPISVDSTRSISPAIEVIDSVPSPTRDEGFDSQDFQCVWYYKHDLEEPVPVWLPWPPSKISILLADFLNLWEQHDTKPSDTVKVLCASKSRRGVTVWKDAILGDILLQNRLPGLVIAHRKVTDLHGSIKDVANLAFEGDLPCGDIIEL